jgi:biotin synthase
MTSTAASQAASADPCSGPALDHRGAGRPVRTAVQRSVVSRPGSASGPPHTNAIQRSTLLSIKTGGCSEDCGYCSQSAHHGEAQREALLEVDEVVAAAQAARDKGASRFCMGAAWRGPKDKDLDRVADMIGAVKALGMETCVTLGMLKDGQAERLKDAGLDYYNHNLDTAPEFYGQVITTHPGRPLRHPRPCPRGRHQALLRRHRRHGRDRRQRASPAGELANMSPPPESVPINELVPMPGTPLENAPPLDPFEFVRTIAVARITMPGSMVRLSAGRQQMSDELQALCFLAGANSIFYGDKLLTAGNPEADRDEALFARLGLTSA